MLRKAIALTIAIGYCMLCGGCYRHGYMPRSELATDRMYRITEVVLVSGETVRFVPRPAVSYYGTSWGTIQDGLIVGWVRDNWGLEQVSIPLSGVSLFKVRKIDVASTVIVSILGVAVIAAGIGLATKESCPFIYSYDGQHYLFDGEPYGGATCPALQRTDFCRLDHLRPVHGKYRLLLTNEVNETQHTDEIQLLAVDHAPTGHVIPDADGQFHWIQSPRSLIHAADAHGKDVTVWLKSSDELWWESDMRHREPGDLTTLRDSLLLCFGRPPNATEVNLVANVGTTLWGSQMLKRAEILWGADLPQWQSSLFVPWVRAGLDDWNRREEAYVLPVRVWDGDQWSVRGELLGGGPFISEDRVLCLNLDGVPGDTLRILLTPAAGFWQMNWFAVDYSPTLPIAAQDIRADSAVGHDGDDIRTVLESSDGRYYTAPNAGQTAELCFTVPDIDPGLTRTVFARVSGYYDIHHDGISPKQDSVLTRVREEPGYFARFALEEFSRWFAEYYRSPSGNTVEAP